MSRVIATAATVLTVAGFSASGAEAKRTGCRTHACKARTCKTWACQRRVLSGAMKATLRRLRACESTGNYRATNGQYTGAYQYSNSTWARAGGYGRAMDASPAEQDVRTARFYPSHRGEWECQA